ncbi:hypothetical protein I7I53_04792 [Histoplasma capsulatum var. duboisii H88]|uniref:Uncharacterized protein n=1 Tax=Ajellomyces capsulatus (strain H88) TaxID=544711 RepID=A0A8A1LTQ6_AJEC8|nr:hypothetical protein I7I53_04792 [Histoplasma capsulatum var. duboisii H88]
MPPISHHTAESRRTGIAFLLAYLLTTGEEKLVRVGSIADRTSQERDPVKDQRWSSLIQKAKEQLVDKIECDGCYKSEHTEGPDSGPGHGEKLDVSWTKIICGQMTKEKDINGQPGQIEISS